MERHNIGHALQTFPRPSLKNEFQSECLAEPYLLRRQVNSVDGQRREIPQSREPEDHINGSVVIGRQLASDTLPLTPVPPYEAVGRRRIRRQGRGGCLEGSVEIASGSRS